MKEAFLVGASLGVFIGMLAGLICLLLLVDVFAPKTGPLSWWERTFGRQQTSGAGVIRKLLMLPVFACGGHWCTGAVLQQMHLEDIRAPYILTFVITHVLITIVPVIYLIIEVCRRVRGSY